MSENSKKICFWDPQASIGQMFNFLSELELLAQ
jgi:hypothetical protein